jgi:hypothetical protein
MRKGRCEVEEAVEGAVTSRSRLRHRVAVQGEVDGVARGRKLDRLGVVVTVG